jgi:hypothetical protein
MGATIRGICAKCHRTGWLDGPYPQGVCHICRSAKEPNMKRRGFFGYVIAGIIGAVAPAAAEGPPLRKVYRQTPTGWERCRMYELRHGDVCKIVMNLPGDNGEIVIGTVQGNPSKQGEHWGVQVMEQPKPHA